MTNLIITILAGGMGTRMKSSIPKVLHHYKNKPMIVHIIEQVIQFDPFKIIIVVGIYEKIIRETINKYVNGHMIDYVIQRHAIGTGDAVKSTLYNMNGIEGINIILNGDMPLLKYHTLSQIYDYYKENNYKMLITSAKIDNPYGYGRIICDNHGKFIKITEEKECSDIEKNIKFINAGIYIVDIKVLHNVVPLISNNNAKNEYYLTDIGYHYNNTYNMDVGIYYLNMLQNNEIANINTLADLNIINNNEL